MKSRKSTVASLTLGALLVAVLGPIATPAAAAVAAGRTAALIIIIDDDDEKPTTTP